VLRLVRPRQWTKNLLVFAAPLFAGKLFEAGPAIQACVAFASFCLLASSTYALNDVLDADRDRQHPGKARRPVASGALSPIAALTVSAACACAGLLLAAAVNGAFVGAGLAYLALTLFYSALGKNVPVLDILLIASGFLVRAVAGALAVTVPSSSWFLACTLFAAVFVALCKRKAELSTLAGDATRHRPVLAAYTPAMLQTLIGASMAAVLLSFTLYVFDVRARADVQFHPLELTLPCVLYGLFRYYLLVETRGLGGSPEEVLLADRGIQLAGVLFVVVSLVSVKFWGVA
jgi:4-hydroxybenzoate polyprenyltransferase